jgi:hypothetical protein
VDAGTTNGSHSAAELINGITEWRINRDLEPGPTMQWRNLLEGRPTRAWEVRQESYWQNTRKQRHSTTKWLSDLTSKFVVFSWAMWDDRNKTLHEKETHLVSEMIDGKNQALVQAATKIAKPTTRLRRFIRQAAQIQNKPLGVKQHWNFVVSAAIRRELREQEKRNEPLRRQQWGLREWLKSIWKQKENNAQT